MPRTARAPCQPRDRAYRPEIADVYTAKYRAAIEDFGMGVDAIMEKYSVVIVVTPTKLMAW